MKIIIVEYNMFCKSNYARLGVELLTLKGYDVRLWDITPIAKPFFFKNYTLPAHQVLPKEVRCMGRKIDGEQCTRSRRNGCDYCLSHSKRLPHGRIDDPNYVKKVKGKRGRKKKSIRSKSW